MEYITRVGDWVFEVTHITARKTSVFGEQYSAIAQLNIANGKLCVEGLLSKEKFTRKDRENLAEFIGMLGFQTFEYSRYKCGLVKEIKGEV